MSEVRDGYTNPISATTQAEKYGAWVRGQEEARAIERAKPLPTDTAPQPVSFEVGHLGNVGSRGRSAEVTSAPSAASGTAKAGAILLALLALGYAYSLNVRGGIELGAYALAGSVVGYVCGWLLHWSIVIAGVVLKWAIKIAAWCFLAYLAFLIVSHLR